MTPPPIPHLLSTTPLESPGVVVGVFVGSNDEGVDDGLKLGLLVVVDSLFIIPEGDVGTIRLADGELLVLIIRLVGMEVSVGVDVTVGLSVGLGNSALS